MSEKITNVNDVTRENWILSTFPEWGQWLNEEIENTTVPENNFTMWWLGNTGLWIKTHENTNIVCDLWCGSGKRTHGDGKMRAGHQMMRMSGVNNVQQNLRISPFVIDPFKMKNVDALVVTHTHSDHLDINTAAAVLKQGGKDVKFIGPAEVVKTWIKWGVPADQTITVKPGDEVQVKSVKIKAFQAYDRTELVTAPVGETLKGKMPQDMDPLAVNYLFETSGGNIYHAGDSHYSNYFAKDGNENKIDVALGAYGENPPGIQNKVTSVDILRMAEDLKTKVMIPVHYDVWSNFQADPKEIVELWKMKKDRLDYKFQPFIWQVGGKYTYPQDVGKIEYHYPRGFEDVFTKEPDLPFPSLL